jgi:hypothetical protein
MMSQDFTLDAYGNLLENLTARGYEARDYAGADPGAAHLILRHDVDMDLDAAVELAQLEAEKGFAATYFVLLGSELYNPASNRNRASLERIRALGHRIGLHFDAVAYDDVAEIQIAALNNEILRLEGIAGTSITRFSFHRPARSLVGKHSPVSGVISAYAPRFVEDFAYVSDSRGGWHYGHPLDNEKVSRGMGLHLLTHPIWWVGSGDDPQSKLEWLARRQARSYRHELAANCESFKAE